MPVNLFKRGTLLIPSGPAHDPERMHLFVICSDPDDDGRQLVVPCCSIKNDLHDRTCVLGIHDHRWIIKPSFVNYRHAEIIAQDQLATGVAQEKFCPKNDMNLQTFLRVTNGIPRSRATPALIKAYYLAGKAGQRIAA